MGNLKFGRGAISVEIGDELDRMIRRGLAETRPGLLRHLEEAAKSVGAGATARWPVKTGKSKAAMQWGVRLIDEGIEAFVLNDANNGGFPYVYAIRSRSGTQMWKELVRRPMERRGAKLVDELGAIASRAMGV